MSISTYAELQTAVENWLHRSNLTARIPEFISMGEAYLNREVIAADMVQTDTVNTSTSDRVAALPTRCLNILTLANPHGEKLAYADAGEVMAYSLAASAGLPRHYSVTDQIEFDRVSDQVYALSCKYRKRLDIAADSTNWLLTNHPDAYLYSALYVASPYIRNDARAGMLKGMMDDAIRAVNHVKYRPALRVDAALVRDGVFDIMRGE